MSKPTTIPSWVGIIILGLAHGILEDLVFLRLLVPNIPPSWDLTGDLFFTFTLPLAQIIALAVTGTFAWFVLGIQQWPKLVTFWALWVTARSFFLFQLYNPVADVAIYVLWITLWCALIGLLARFVGSRSDGSVTGST